MLALSVGSVATIVALWFVSDQAAQSRAQLEDIVTVELKLSQLDAQIVYLDEVLTMSARMAAATGHPRWRERYDAHVEPLDEALAEVIAMAPAAMDAQAGAETDAANDVLISMEADAFAAIEQGDLATAQALLSSERYEGHKRRYARGMQRVSAAIETRVAQRIAEARARSKRLGKVILSVFFAVLVLWASVAVYVVSIIRDVAEQTRQLADARRTMAERQRSDAERSAAELARLNGALEVRVSELHVLQERLADESRRAGMADVAKSVLHNIGNALNSVSVGFGLLRDQPQHDVSGMRRALTQLESQDDLAAFFGPGGQGDAWMRYLHASCDAIEHAEQRRRADTLHLFELVAKTLAIVETHHAYVADSPDLRNHTAVDALLPDGVALNGESYVVAVDRSKAQALIAELVHVVGDGQEVRAHAMASADGVTVVLQAQGAPITDDLFAPTGRLHQAACVAAELGAKLQPMPTERGVTLRLTPGRA